MLSTGLRPLDRRLRGGIPPGTLLAFTAPPDTQSELVLEELARTHDATYVTTVRNADAVAERLPDATVRGVAPGELLADPDLEVPDGGLLVVDSVTRLEEDTETYVDFLEEAARSSSEADGVVMLHAHQPDRQPPGRWLTLARADMTWQLSLYVSPLAVETRLAVTKNRHGAAMTEPLKLRLTDHVAVDTSRDI